MTTDGKLGNSTPAQLALGGAGVLGLGRGHVGRGREPEGLVEG